MPVQQPIDEPDYSALSLYTNSTGQHLSTSGASPVPEVFQLRWSSPGNISAMIGYRITFDMGAAPWLSLSGVSSPFRITGYSGYRNISLQLGDISNLAPGTYTAEIYFATDDSFSAGIDDGSGTTYVVTLDIAAGTASNPQFLKSQYNVVFNRQSGLLSGDTVVGLKNADGLTFQAQHFNSVTVGNDSVQLAGSLASDGTLPKAGLVHVVANLVNASGNAVATAQINLNIVENNDVAFGQTSLGFSINKSQGQQQVQQLTVIDPAGADFTISTQTDWLKVSASSGNSTSTLSISANAAELSSGTYRGSILLSAGGRTLTLPVTLEVLGFIKIDNANSFALDLQPVIFTKQSAAAKFIRIKVDADYGTEQKTHIYSLPYLNDKASFDLGPKIHRMFPKVRKPYFEIDSDTLRSSVAVTLTVEELDSAYASLLQENISNIHLFPGRKPTAYPLLTNYLHRSTKNGAVYFVSKIIGDKMSVERKQILDPEISVYPFPDNFIKILVQWENQNLSPEWACFSGEYKIGAEYSHIYARDIFNLQNEKYDFTRARILTLNTGFLLKYEQKMILEIVESACVFLKIEGAVYRAFATTQKITEVESDAEIISKDLEFLIVE